MVLEELEGQKRERESYGAKRRKDEATQEFVIVFFSSVLEMQKLPHTLRILC